MIRFYWINLKNFKEKKDERLTGANRHESWTGPWAKPQPNQTVMNPFWTDLEQPYSKQDEIRFLSFISKYRKQD